MDKNYKLQIYKGIIQYLLDSTNYTLKSIADLSNSPINEIRSIYSEDSIPVEFSSGLQLTKLFHFILELEETKRKEF